MKRLKGEGEYEFDKEDREEVEDEEEEEDEEDEDKEEEDREGEEDREEADGEGEEEAAAPGSSGDDYRSFFLPSIWSVNDFLSKMKDRVFNNLGLRYQIPYDVPIRIEPRRRSATLAEPQTSVFTRLFL